MKKKNYVRPLSVDRLFEFPELMVSIGASRQGFGEADTSEWESPDQESNEAPARRTLRENTLWGGGDNEKSNGGVSLW
jgi:hypothetical protein